MILPAQTTTSHAGSHRHAIGKTAGIGLGLRLANHHPAYRSGLGKSVDMIIIKGINTAGMAFALGIIDLGHHVKDIFKAAVFED